MALRMMMSMKVALAFALVLSIFMLKAKSQPLGCSFQGLQLDKCLNQEGGYIFLEPCCRALNQALRTGFHCLCSMFTTNAPELTTLFSLSLSSCYIMVPPLTMCRDIGTMPVSLPLPPNASTKEFGTAQQIPQVPLPPTPQANSIPLGRSTPTGNTTVAERQPHSSKNATSMLHVVKNENNVSSSGSEATHNLFCFLCWLLSLGVYAMV